MDYSFLFWFNHSTDLEVKLLACLAQEPSCWWIKNSRSENNLQALQQPDSRNQIASVIESVRRSLAWSHLHGMTVFTVDTIVMAAGTN